MDIMWQEKLEPHISDKKAAEPGPYLLLVYRMIVCYMCSKAGIGQPLEELKAWNAKLISVQAAAMVKSPDR